MKNDCFSAAADGVSSLLRIAVERREDGARAAARRGRVDLVDSVDSVRRCIRCQSVCRLALHKAVPVSDGLLFR